MTAGQPSTVAGQLFLISDFPAVPLGSSIDLRSSNISGTIDKVVQPNLPNEKSFRDLVGSTAPQSESIQYKEVFMIEGDFPKSITMDIENEVNREVRLEEIHIRYDYVPFYCDACKMQGIIPRSENIIIQGRRETPTQRKDVIPISEQIHGENVTIQVVNKPLVCLQSSELPGSSEVNLEKDEEENKALCAASDPVEERDDEIIEDNSKALIAIPHQEVDALPITMLVESLSQAIVECPGVVQLDENQLVHMESPNRVLHNIVSHNLVVGHSGNNDPDATLIAKG
ncbi:hypothetical protein KY284_035780 [Solanum tuberosum]|nr:hypothetical protein KY284_035780 [Solanum tuberosum]